MHTIERTMNVNLAHAERPPATLMVTNLLSAEQDARSSCVPKQSPGREIIVAGHKHPCPTHARRLTC